VNKRTKEQITKEQRTKNKEQRTKEQRTIESKLTKTPGTSFGNHRQKTPPKRRSKERLMSY
jgi:hypothetical protein